MNHLVMDKQRIQSLTEDFAASSPVLIALGDETRIHIVLAMLSAAQNHEHCEGVRVGELAKISSLSRPAIEPPHQDPQRSGDHQKGTEGRDELLLP
jgi:hypothetical protein